MRRHVIGFTLCPESEAAIARATNGGDPALMVYEAAAAAVADLIQKGKRGLEADRLAAEGAIEVGRAVLDLPPARARLMNPSAWAVQESEAKRS